MNDQTLITLLILSGVAHIIMSLLSITVPTMLNWKPHLDAAPPLLRHVFWTYSAYIKLVCISIGLVSIIGAHELLGPSILAKSLNLFIVVFWVGRLGVEFFYYDRSTLQGIAKLSDRSLNVLIVVYILVHGAAFARSMQWI
jgi:hypothetical protein